MNNHNSTDTIAGLLTDIERGQALERLFNNDDFKEIIMKGYIEDTLLNKSDSLCHSNENDRLKLHEELLSVSYLKAYFNTVKNSGQTARMDIGE